MVATDVASRGIGMIERRSPGPPFRPPSPFPSSVLFAYLTIQTSCDHRCNTLSLSLSLSLRLGFKACLRTLLVQATYGPRPGGILDFQCSLT
jgi:hypothetical protein